MIYDYTIVGVFSLSQLINEVVTAEVNQNLLDVSSDDDVVTFSYAIALSTADKTTLDGVVAAHVAVAPDSEETLVKLSSANTYDNIPIIYTTPKPLDHYTVFQGAGDSATAIGEGEDIFFQFPQGVTGDTISKDITFNEDVYIKDGHITCIDVPIHSYLNVDIVHPVYNVTVKTFAKHVHMYGDHTLIMDTEDRAMLPAGMIVRISVKRGNIEANSDREFFVSGRLELFRKEQNV